MTPALSMAQTAEAVGMAYRTFRREWPRMVLELGFPNPFRPYAWDAALVSEWRAGRSRRANDIEPAPIAGKDPTINAAARQRARFQRERLG